MDILKACLLAILLLITSCAKMSYLVEQGIGQYDLLTSSRPNDVYLKDSETPSEIKRKIQQVEQARDYFYEYWGTEKQKTYSRTTLLDREAVSYLVISSPSSVIRPEESCFWFVGCFPYLGFFSQKKAYEFADKQQAQSLETYVRPVYAYSSLGYFEDPILSSFFVFDEVKLTELVFHELYHLHFFVKDEVELNENLAQFFAEKMVEDYLELSTSARKKKEKAFQQIRQDLVKLTAQLQKKYEEIRAENKENFKQVREDFLNQRFYPHFKKLCADLEVSEKKCFPLHGKWNNARLAAFLTYEKKGEELAQLYKREGRDLKRLQLYIQDKYQQYESEDSNQSFADFLFETD